MCSLCVKLLKVKCKCILLLLDGEDKRIIDTDVMNSVCFDAIIKGSGRDGWVTPRSKEKHKKRDLVSYFDDVLSVVTQLIPKQLSIHLNPHPHTHAHTHKGSRRPFYFHIPLISCRSFQLVTIGDGPPVTFCHPRAERGRMKLQGSKVVFYKLPVEQPVCPVSSSPHPAATLWCRPTWRPEAGDHI